MHGNIAKKLAIINDVWIAWARYSIKPWPVLYNFHAKKNIGSLLFRGISLDTGDNNVDLWSLFKDIWIDESYCRHGVSIMPGSTIIDIGANIGVFSIYAAFKGAGAVYCFEPFPKNHDRLLQNTKKSGFEKVLTASCEAVLSKTGTQRLYLSDCDAGHLMFHKNISTGLVKKYIDVPTVSLEDIFRRYEVEHCDLLKLDCEGAEYDILLKCPDALLERISQITMEVHNNVPGVSPSDIQAALEQRGFMCSCDMHGQTFGYMYAVNKGKKM